MLGRSLVCKQSHIALPAAATSTSAARVWVADRLGALFSTLSVGLGQDVAVIVSELATNCVRSGASRFEVALEVHHEQITVAASDTAPDMPVRRTPEPSSATGRGLNIVAALSDRWGVTARDVGKTVWAELVVPDGSGAGFTCKVVGRLGR